MRYIIIYQGKVSYTDWFTTENHYITGMMVIDMVNDTFTTDGEIWQDIEFDHL